MSYVFVIQVCEGCAVTASWWYGMETYAAVSPPLHSLHVASTNGDICSMRCGDVPKHAKAM